MAEKENKTANNDQSGESQEELMDKQPDAAEKTNEAGKTREEMDEEELAEQNAEKETEEDVMEKMAGKLADLTDKHLRLQAEFDNFRRRTLKEKTELIKAGGESVLVNILPVIDDFERALNLLENVPDTDPGKQGTKLIYAKFLEFLKQNNVKEIAALHQNFDVEHHEAVTKIPAPKKDLKGKVVDVIQKGYLLNDKVIRFAKVVIGE